MSPDERGASPDDRGASSNGRHECERLSGQHDGGRPASRVAPGMRALKALGALLTYPTPELVAALPEIRAAIDEGTGLGRSTQSAVHALVDQLAAADPYDVEETYVGLFDRGRRTSLHLFEHVHGESRDRGQAMVDLQAMYARGGLTLRGNELPDYLPAVLEYLSTRPIAEVRDMLEDCAHILRRIGEALVDRGSGYAAVFAALLEIARVPGLALDKARREPQPEEKPIDEEWAEEPVVFGPGAAPSSCGAQTAAQSGVARPRP